MVNCDEWLTVNIRDKTKNGKVSHWRRKLKWERTTLSEWLVKHKNTVTIEWVFSDEQCIFTVCQERRESVSGKQIKQSLNWHHHCVKQNYREEQNWEAREDWRQRTQKGTKVNKPWTEGVFMRVLMGKRLKWKCKWQRMKTRTKRGSSCPCTYNWHPPWKWQLLHRLRWWPCIHRILNWIERRFVGSGLDDSWVHPSKCHDRPLGSVYVHHFAIHGTFWQKRKKRKSKCLSRMFWRRHVQSSKSISSTWQQRDNRPAVKSLISRRELFVSDAEGREWQKWEKKEWLGWTKGHEI